MEAPKELHGMTREEYKSLISFEASEAGLRALKCDESLKERVIRAVHEKIKALGLHGCWATQEIFRAGARLIRQQARIDGKGEAVDAWDAWYEEYYDRKAREWRERRDAAERAATAEATSSIGATIPKAGASSPKTPTAIWTAPGPIAMGTARCTTNAPRRA